MEIKAIVLTLLASHVASVVIIVVLIACHANNRGEINPDQGSPAQTHTSPVEGSQDRKERSLTLDEANTMMEKLQKMFDESLENTTEIEEPSIATVSEISKLKPLVHLTGIDMNLTSPALVDTEWTEVTGWMTAGKEEMVRNGFEVKGGRLIIPISGCYRVYVHLKFCANGTVHNQSLPFELNLYRMDAVSHTEDRLLGNGKSHLLEDGGVIGSTPHVREYGMYAQTVDHFNALDEVYVKAKYVTALLSDREWSYMGAHILDTKRKCGHGE